MKVLAGALLSMLVFPSVVRAFSGTEGGSFLDIPVGARPAALGGAYSTLASDAYATTSNPAGLGFLLGPELAAMHLMYVVDISYEQLSYVHPVGSLSGLGLSVQYFRPGTVTALDDKAVPIGNFNGSMASYNLAYGRRLGDALSIGATGKYIDESIDNVGAHAFAADVGVLYQLTPEIRLAGVGANFGQKLKFLSESDTLPRQERVGVSYTSSHRWTAALEGVHRDNQALDEHAGFECRSHDGYALRVGYSTERIRELTPLSGFSVGLGLPVQVLRIDYTYSPMGTVGDTHYLSLVYPFGKAAERAVLSHARYPNLDNEDLYDPEFTLNEY